MRIARISHGSLTGGGGGGGGGGGFPNPVTKVISKILVHHSTTMITPQRVDILINLSIRNISR